MDGSSTDGTLALADQYKSENDADDNGHKVVVVSSRDKGLYDAMNKGICRATGDYVLFLNAGDKFHSPDTLETIASYVADGERLPAVIYGDTDIVGPDGHFIRHRRLSPPDNLTWKSFKKGMLVCHQAFYARADIAKSTLYDLSFRYSADIDWCIRVMKQACERNLALRRVPEVVVDYLSEGMTTANRRASLAERFAVMCRHYGFFTTLAMHVWFVFRAALKK